MATLDDVRYHWDELGIPLQAIATYYGDIKGAAEEAEAAIRDALAAAEKAREFEAWQVAGEAEALMRHPGVAPGGAIGLMGQLGAIFSYQEAMGVSISEAKRAILAMGEDWTKYAGYEFQHGGIVPGPIGSPVPIIAHAGETVIPVGRQMAYSGSPGMMGKTEIHIHAGALMGNEAEARQFAAMINDYLRQENIARIGSVAT